MAVSTQGGSTGVPALDRNSRAKHLYHNAAQLPRDGGKVCAFMRTAVRAVGMQPDLLTCFEVLYHYVRQTDTFPQGFEFEVRTPEGRTVLGESGYPKEHLETLAERALAAHEREPKGTITLTGASEIEPQPIAYFLQAYSRGGFSRQMLVGCLDVPEYLEELWDLNLFRTFVADHGKRHWIHPMDDLIALYRKLTVQPGGKLFADSILDAMIDAGKMGHCPTRYLRTVILPQFERLRNSHADFVESTTLWGRVFAAVQEDTRNYATHHEIMAHTVEYLLSPLSSPRSKLYIEGYYDDGILSREGAAFSIAEQWLAFVEGDNEALLELFRRCASRFVEVLVRVETPGEIVKQITAVLTHLRYVHETFDDVDLARRYDIDTHENGIDVYYKRARRYGHYAAFLQIMIAHYDTVQRFATERFPRTYEHYLAYFGWARAESADDIRTYLASYSRIESTGTDGLDERLVTALSRVRTAEDREQLLDYVTRCRLFDPSLFARWRDAGAAARDAMIEELNALVDSYLIDPYTSVTVEAVREVDPERLEASLIRSHVRTSIPIKREIDQVLRRYHIPDGIGIEPELAGLSRIELPARGTGGREVAVASRDRTFVLRLHQLVHTVLHLKWDDAEIERRNRVILAEAIAKYNGMVRTFGITKRELERCTDPRKADGLVNKLKGLRHQLKESAPVIQLLRRGKRQGAEVRRRIEQIATVMLLREKRFAKRHGHAFAVIPLLYAVSRCSPEDLREGSFGVIRYADEVPETFSPRLLEALREIIYSNSQTYFVDLFRDGADLPADAIETIRRAYAIPDDDPGLAGCIDPAIVDFRNAMAQRAMEEEIEHVLRQIETASSRRNVGFVAGRRKLDLFFGHVGELCISREYDEILRSDLQPIRIIDLDSSALTGYVLFYLGDEHVESPGEHRRIGIVAGIEPKSSWMSDLPVKPFYEAVIDYLIDRSAAMGLELLCFVDYQHAWSNCYPLSRVIQADLKSRPIHRLEKPLVIAGGWFRMGQARVLWERPAAEATPRPNETPRATSPS